MPTTRRAERLDGAAHSRRDRRRRDTHLHGNRRARGGASQSVAQQHGALRVPEGLVPHPLRRTDVDAWRSRGVTMTTTQLPLRARWMVLVPTLVFASGALAQFSDCTQA